MMQSIHQNNMLCLENINMWFKLSIELATLAYHIIIRNLSPVKHLVQNMKHSKAIIYNHTNTHVSTI